MKKRWFFLQKKLKQKKKKKIISQLIPDLFSCPTHLYQTLAPKIDKNEQSKKKLPSQMYDNFYAHLVETNLKNQALNMPEKLKEKIKKEFPYILQRKDTGLLV